MFVLMAPNGIAKRCSRSIDKKSTLVTKTKSNPILILKDSDDIKKYYLNVIKGRVLGKIGIIGKEKGK